MDICGRTTRSILDRYHIVSEVDVLRQQKKWTQKVTLKMTLTPKLANMDTPKNALSIHILNS